MLQSEKAEIQAMVEGVAQKIKAQIEPFAEETKERMSAVVDRLVALERSKATGSPAHRQHDKVTLSQHVMGHANLKSMLDGNGKSCRIDLPAGMLSATKAAIVSDGQVLSPAMRVPGIVAQPLRVARVRDLFPVGTTGNNLVEFTRENVYTNAAAPQAGDGELKAESSISFTLEEAPVRTLAHWIPVSKQVLADAQQMASYLNVTLLHGLKVVEDAQLLSGDGTGSNIKGILAAGNNLAAPAAVGADNPLDRILRTFAALAVDELVPDGVLLHPNDWAAFQLTKNAQEDYLLGSPGSATAPSIWGVPVVATTAIAEGTFCVGAFAMGAQVWDREQASVQVSMEDRDNFVKNMATILAEERLALTVYRPKAFRKGTL